MTFLRFCLLATAAVEQIEWRELTASELNNWYTPLDLCTLNSSKRVDFPSDIRARDCKHLSKGSRRLHCGVGMGSNNKACTSPYLGRPHFKKGIKGYIDHTKTPILNTMKYLIASNASLVFIGNLKTALHTMHAKYDDNQATRRCVKS